VTDIATSDVARVRQALDDGTLLHPNEGVANSVHLAQAMACLGGATIELTSANARELAGRIGQHNHYVFVLVDGMGMNLIDALPHDAFLRTHLAAELRAVFPSSTAPALTSVATARWPAEHAVTGWWTYLPEAGLTATILPYIERFSEQPLEPRGVAPSYAFPIASCARTFSHAYMMFTPRPVAGSVYSRYSTSDAPFASYGKLAGGIDAIIARIASARETTYSYLYISKVDYEEHLHGPHSPEASNALYDVQAQLERLAGALGGHARLVITADHGLFTVGKVSIVDRDDALVAMLRVPPSGDGRAPLFHVERGQRDAFAATFRDRYGDRFALLTNEEAETMELFGPVALSDETRRRIGDYVGIALADDVLMYEPKQDDKLRGHHGGLTPDEMRIPLVLC
jgi:hypothetical protein